MHLLNVEAGVPSRLLMYTLIYWLCRMHTTQLQPQFLGLRAQWSELKRHLTYSCSHVSSEHALSQKGLAINLASCGLSSSVRLFLIIIGDQFGQGKFLINDLAYVSDTCGKHEKPGPATLFPWFPGTRLRYPRERRILASPSSRVVFFFAATLLLA